MGLMITIVVVLLSFLIGSVPFAYIVARIKGIDLTKVGSGNIGATNVWRSIGPAAGTAVFFLDFFCFASTENCINRAIFVIFACQMFCN